MMYSRDMIYFYLQQRADQLRQPLGKDFWDRAGREPVYMMLYALSTEDRLLKFVAKAVSDSNSYLEPDEEVSWWDTIEPALEPGRGP
jgi:hypothetical protein